MLKPESTTFYQRYVLFIKYGFQSIYPLSIFLRKIFYSYDEKEKTIKDYFYKYDDTLNRKICIERKKQLQINKFNKRILSMVVWPDNIREIKESEYNTIHSVRDVDFKNEYITGKYFSDKLQKEIQYESMLERDILAIIEECEQVKFYEVQPLKIPYVYNQKNKVYIPDILFVLNDGRGIIVECKPKILMPLDSNLKKYHVLKRYCNEKGLGMIVTDGRTSMERLMSYNINKEFEMELKGRLRLGRIRWHELQEIKDKHKATTEDLLSVIISNNLYYDREPFVLTIRNSEL